MFVVLGRGPGRFQVGFHVNNGVRILVVALVLRRGRRERDGWSVLLWEGVLYIT